MTGSRTQRKPELPGLYCDSGRASMELGGDLYEGTLPGQASVAMSSSLHNLRVFDIANLPLETLSKRKVIEGFNQPSHAISLQTEI